MGVPINMGIERRPEYRLLFPIIGKSYEVHQKEIESLMSWPKCRQPSFYL